VIKRHCLLDKINYVIFYYADYVYGQILCYLDASLMKVFVQLKNPYSFGWMCYILLVFYISAANSK